MNKTRRRKNQHSVTTTPMLTSIYKWLTNKPIKAARYVAPITVVLLAGVIVSYIRRGDWTVAFSIVVASFLNCPLKKKVAGEAVKFLQASGLDTHNRRLQTFLAFVVFSTAFDILIALVLRVVYKELFLDNRIAKPALTALLITLANLSVLSGDILRILHLNAFLLASRSLRAASSSKWSLYSVQDPPGYSLNDIQGIDQVSNERDRKGSRLPKGQDVVQGTDTNLARMKQGFKELPGLWLKDWELVENEGEGENGASVCSDQEKRIQALFDDVNHLIDECQERKDVDWDGVIAVLEKGQNDCKVVEEQKQHVDK
ncbi:hypothetical protein GMOD_00003286 [Pyrenophora seminiperda CCB06]|uniref:Uncharacterized protein n=1 Tax=Pyrenophora seminiperda CCB06 TaxID=1302712 RepID=A0A3M7MIF5_9PLEO|nr:hypothetical protein GMOD_00003286 [Pyrenophora seminiperda CCB06]